MKQFFLFLILSLISVATALAQLDLSAFTATGRGGAATTFATDYQTLGINPANLGFHKSYLDPKLTFGFFEASGSVFTQAFGRSDLMQLIRDPSAQQLGTYDDKISAIDQIAEKDFNINSNIMWLGASLRLPGKQSISFNVRDRVQFYGRISQNATELLFMGANSSYFPRLLLSNGESIDNPRFGNPEAPVNNEGLANSVVRGFFEDEDESSGYGAFLNGTRVSVSWVREYNFGYGKQIVNSYDFRLYLGVGVRIMSGFALIDLNSEGNDLRAANLSVSPSFGLSLGDGSSSPSFSKPSNSTFGRLVAPRSIGSGLGTDLGITMVFKRKIYVGAAVTNVGQFWWNGSTYQINSEGRLVQMQGLGLNNLNILAYSPGTINFAGDRSPLQWSQSGPIISALPTQARLGASYEYFKLFHVGFDVVVPLNDVAGNLDKPFWALGMEFQPFRVIRISSGINYNAQKLNVPAGIAYLGRKGFYEAGIATQDLSNLLLTIGNSTTLSIASGFLRFKI